MPIDETQYSEEMQRRRREAQEQYDARNTNNVGRGGGGFLSQGGQGDPFTRHPSGEITGGRLSMDGSRQFMDEYWQREMGAADAARAGIESGESSVALNQARIAQGQAAQAMLPAGGNPLAARAAMGGYQQQAVAIAGEGGMGRAGEMNDMRALQAQALARRGDIEGDLQTLSDARARADAEYNLMVQQANAKKKAAREGSTASAITGGVGAVSSGLGDLATNAQQEEDQQTSDRRWKYSMMRGIR